MSNNNNIFKKILSFIGSVIVVIFALMAFLKGCSDGALIGFFIG